jgi:hypothetical protein
VVASKKVTQLVAIVLAVPVRLAGTPDDEPADDEPDAVAEAEAVAAGVVAAGVVAGTEVAVLGELELLHAEIARQLTATTAMRSDPALDRVFI